MLSKQELKTAWAELKAAEKELSDVPNEFHNASRLVACVNILATQAGLVDALDSLFHEAIEFTWAVLSVRTGDTFANDFVLFWLGNTTYPVDRLPRPCLIAADMNKLLRGIDPKTRMLKTQEIGNYLLIMCFVGYSVEGKRKIAQEVMELVMEAPSVVSILVAAAERVYLAALRLVIQKKRCSIDPTNMQYLPPTAPPTNTHVLILPSSEIAKIIMPPVPTGIQGTSLLTAHVPDLSANSGEQSVPTESDKPSDLIKEKKSIPHWQSWDPAPSNFDPVPLKGNLDDLSMSVETKATKPKPARLIPLVREGLNWVQKHSKGHYSLFFRNSVERMGAATRLRAYRARRKSEEQMDQTGPNQPPNTPEQT